MVSHSSFLALQAYRRLTPSARGMPSAPPTRTTWKGARAVDALDAARVGVARQRRPRDGEATRLVGEHRGVTLVLPPREADDRSLLVDGTVDEIGDGELVVRPEGAVLHRPA